MVIRLKLELLLQSDPLYWCGSTCEEWQAEGTCFCACGQRAALCSQRRVPIVDDCIYNKWEFGRGLYWMSEATCLCFNVCVSRCCVCWHFFDKFYLAKYGSGKCRSTWFVNIRSIIGMHIFKVNKIAFSVIHNSFWSKACLSRHIIYRKFS